MELSALVWICIHDVDSVKYLDSALTAKYLNIWIRLLAALRGFGFSELWIWIRQLRLWLIWLAWDSASAAIWLRLIRIQLLGHGFGVD